MEQVSKDGQACRGDYPSGEGRNLPNEGDSSESKPSCSLPLELVGLALGTMEKVRTRGAPAFPGSTGFADF